MALSTLAEWTGSAIVSNLVDTAYAYLGERMLPADIEEELTRLKTALPKIKAVMSVSEALKFKYPNSGVNEWLNNFKEAFFAADDVLDELKYWKLAEKVKTQAQVSESSSSILASLKRKFPSSNISNGTIERLRKAVKMLDLATTEFGSFFQFAIALHGHNPAQPHCESSNISSRETTSFLTESKVFGHKNERAKVIEWLKKPASDAPISAFCIVGPGGLGKTTLAQLIYKEMDDGNHFDKIIWVCVSTSFNVEDITRKILEELGEKSKRSESLNGLQNSLKKKIHSKKVLFILDDVWNDNKMGDWETLIAPLRSVKEESRILLTTRMKSVVQMVAHVLDVNQQYLDFKGLENQELLLLFNKYAFHGYKPINYKGLQTIGKDIVKKLWGSPLAAKVIGKLLNSNMDSNYWRRILKCDSFLNLEDAKEVADILRLSYFHLPTAVQQCFRFCAIFPQDYEFEKDALIRLWMASGFLGKQSYAEDRPEDTGEKYFNHLIMMSFFEPHPWRESYYIMHDLVHELARNVSKGECCRIESNDMSINIPNSVQHVYVDRCNIEKIFHLRNLRTLIIRGPKFYSTPFIISNDSLKETLRVLDVNLFNKCDMPEEICGLVHLRYLTFRGLQKNVLPFSIYKLHHLKVLEWNGQRIVTTGMTNLVSLRYMKLPNEMMQNIKGVGILTSLQELKFYVGNEKGQHIDELKVLNNLRELSIQKIENVRDPTEVWNAELSKKESLISLSLIWTAGSNPNNPEHILDKLQPSPTLKNLKIEHYDGHRSPNWMKDMPRLELSSFSLFNCPLWEDLPLLAQMPNLRDLSLKRMGEVKELDYSLDNTGNDHCPFPSLEKLSCGHMPNWTSWAGPLSNYGFPNLRELTISKCPSLTELPALPLSLVHFVLENVGLNSIPHIYDTSSTTTAVPSSLKSSLRSVAMQRCPNLKSLDGFLQQENLVLQALEHLYVSFCNNLVQIPIGAFGKFESLKALSIHGSPKLLPVDNQRNLLPTKLQTLRLGNCGGLDVQLLESAARLSTLHELTILDSPSISRIPSSQNVFPSLRRLNILKCEKLVEYSIVEHARGASPGNNMDSLKINIIDISHLSLLYIEPLRSLRFVSTCFVQNCSGLETLPEQWLLQNSSTLKDIYIEDASSLRSLPGTMVRLTALRSLDIREATLLEEVPELPADLHEKRIEGVGGRWLV